MADVTPLKPVEKAPVEEQPGRTMLVQSAFLRDGDQFVMNPDAVVLGVYGWSEPRTVHDEKTGVVSATIVQGHRIVWAQPIKAD